MLTFNSVLKEASIEVTDVRLARHQDKRFTRSPYDLWRANDGSFELYQQTQSEARFPIGSYLASFVATPLDETVFVGLYRVKNVTPGVVGIVDPLAGPLTEPHFVYDLELVTELNDYRGRLVIDWGAGKRSWVQLAHKRPKPVVEFRSTATEAPFLGFLDFCGRLSALPSVPTSWRQALSAVRGVYLLSCPVTGKNYVGSAGGERGFWGRWEEYVASGHGGNQLMRNRSATDYQVSILEIASSTTTLDELIAMENRWKQKLQTRTFGLNAN